MLPTELVAIFAAAASLVALAISGFSVLAARKARDYAVGCRQWAEQVATKGTAKAKIAEIEAEMTELTDAYAALLRSHKKLRSRITMRENREKGLDAGGSVDLGSETNKAQLRIAARQTGLLK